MTLRLRLVIGDNLVIIKFMTDFELNQQNLLDFPKATD